jgi:hypothetical protein
VVLADGEHVQAHLLGELGLLQQVAHPLLRGDAGGEVGEGGKSEFHGCEGSRWLWDQLFGDVRTEGRRQR